MEQVRRQDEVAKSGLEPKQSRQEERDGVGQVQALHEHGNGEDHEQQDEQRHDCCMRVVRHATPLLVLAAWLSVKERSLPRPLSGGSPGQELYQASLRVTISRLHVCRQTCL